MKTLCLSLIIFAILSVSCQTIKLEGNTTQGTGGLSNEYPTKIEMKKSFNRLKGTTWFCMPNDEETFVKMTFRGKIKKDTMYIKESEIIEFTPIAGDWLTKDIKLYYVSKSPVSLQGTWKAHNNEYASGELFLKAVE